MKSLTVSTDIIPTGLGHGTYRVVTTRRKPWRQHVYHVRAGTASEKRLTNLLNGAAADVLVVLDGGHLTAELSVF